MPQRRALCHGRVCSGLGLLVERQVAGGVVVAGLPPLLAVVQHPSDEQVAPENAPSFRGVQQECIVGISPTASSFLSTYRSSPFSVSTAGCLIHRFWSTAAVAARKS